MILGPIFALTIGTFVRLKYFGVFSRTTAGRPKHTDCLGCRFHLLLLFGLFLFGSFAEEIQRDAGGDQYNENNNQYNSGCTHDRTLLNLRFSAFAHIVF